MHRRTFLRGATALAGVAAAEPVLFGRRARLPLGLSGKVPPATSAHPNVLQIGLDDLSPSFLAPYSDKPFAHPSPPPTPTINALFAIGTRFDRYHTNPNCSPTRIETETGADALRYGIGTVCKAILEPWGLPPDQLTLAKALAGLYRRCHIGKWHLAAASYGPIGDQPRIHGGYEDSIACPLVDFQHSSPPYFNWSRWDNGSESLEPGYATTVQVDEAIAYMGSHREERWYINLQLDAPHKPLHNPPASLLPPGYPTPTTPAEQYEAMLVAADTEIGRLLTAIDWTNTVVLLSSDNGTPDDLRHPNQPAGKVKKTVYREGVVAPLVIAGPGVGVPSGLTWSKLVKSCDLPATICDMIGVSASFPNGVSAAQGKPIVFSAHFEPNGPPQTPQPHAQFRIHGPGDVVLLRRDGVEELYDWAVDPEEAVDLLGHPSYATQESNLRAWLDGLYLPTWGDLV